MDDSFEKSEYNYYAAALVFGSRSPKMRDFSAFSFEVFRKQKDLTFNEVTGLNTEGHMEITRNLIIDSDRGFQTSHTDMRSETNRVVSYIDNKFRFCLNDAVFSDDGFDYYGGDWNEIVRNKIRTLGILLESVHLRKIRDIPLLINEFLNISKTLLDHSDFFLVGRSFPQNAIY
jgi:hypothetical protein